MLPDSTPDHLPTQPSPRGRTEALSSDDGEKQKVPKRLVVCCDGTWQDALVIDMPSKYTNILKLSRMMNLQDNRTNPPIPQIVFYQAGVGTDPGIFMNLIAGATGASLGEKVQEAYAFIAHNYQPGDEIYLFGFSRGAYTARMIAALIGEIGILDKNDMDHFADIFLNYEKRAHITNETEKAQLSEKLAPFLSPTAKGRLRADADGDKFTVKVLGVFDTVGALGLPREVSILPHVETLFGFPDTYLGNHIEYAFQAMAIDEVRTDFEVAKFHQTEIGREKGQVLKQVWFSGSHSDIGGGYQAHDLSDITLAWMAASIEQMLSLDVGYMISLPKPVGAWGTQAPHDPITGIFQLASQTPRSLPPLSPPAPIFPTYESIHPSVLCQRDKVSNIKALVSKNPGIVCTLLPLEEEIKKLWTEEVTENVEKCTRRLTEASEADRNVTEDGELFGTGKTKRDSGFGVDGIARLKLLFGAARDVLSVKSSESSKERGKKERDTTGSWLAAVSKEMKS
ncbi:hypothetical protein BU17DRAFT_40748 [Hysterangium stoloniferum]|nr:hypothetical protein BU17DRAFT_40748 [Hysterangium stoloniferum]